jgi:predicted SnoaL-like aldol condensation-catalyzing enzyme
MPDVPTSDPEQFYQGAPLLLVPDVRATADFYRSILGFKSDPEADTAAYWSPDYIQHSAHIEPGRDGLFALIRSSPETLRYEHQLIVAEGDNVILHGRFTGTGRPVAWVAADVVRIEDGRLAEHWDVLQDEATEAESKSGRPMFGNRFPA